MSTNFSRTEPAGEVSPLRPQDTSSPDMPSRFADSPSEAIGERFRYLLFFRFLLVNLVGGALLGLAYADGLVDRVMAADSTGLSAIIFGVFVIGLLICGNRLWNTSRELNLLYERKWSLSSQIGNYLSRAPDRGPESRALLASALRLKLSQRLGLVRHIAETLVLLGLIGTVVGFIIAFSGVKADQAADLNQVSGMIGSLISGMSVALYTTLVGAILHVWLMVNYRLLATGTARLIAGVVETGERYERT